MVFIGTVCESSLSAASDPARGPSGGVGDTKTLCRIIDMCIDMGIDTRMGMGIDMCIGMVIDMCIGMVIRVVDMGIDMSMP